MPQRNSILCLLVMLTAFQGMLKFVGMIEYSHCPSLHNRGFTIQLVGALGKITLSVFAGSWMKRHRERIETLPILLDPALEFGLHIFDRNFRLPGIRRRHRFPARYHSAIKGTLAYAEMLTAYRCYKVMLNTNSVTNSRTMFSRRVFESLACGTPVVSTDSEGMCRILGNYVRVTRCKDDTRFHLSALLNDPELRLREGHLGYRFVHECHTYRHRMNEICFRIGLKEREFVLPAVSVIVPVSRFENVTNALENFSRQTYKKKELILVINETECDVRPIRWQVEAFHNIHIVVVKSPLDEIANFAQGANVAAGDYLVRMNGADKYGEKYLSDTMLTLGFIEAEILGKATYFVHFEEENSMAIKVLGPEHQYTDVVEDATLMIRREVFNELIAKNRELDNERTVLMRAARANCRIYSTDRFNYLLVRRNTQVDSIGQSKMVEFSDNYKNLRSGLDLNRVMI